MRSIGHLAPVSPVRKEVMMPKGGGPDPLKILIGEIRATVRGDRQKAGGWSYGVLESHAQAIIALPALAQELIEARRSRDEAWLRYDMPTAQRRGQRIAAVEEAIEGVLRVLTSPVTRERKRPGVNANVGRVTLDVVERRRKAKELWEAGYSIEQIAARLGVTYEVARRDHAKLEDTGRDQKIE